MCWNIEGLKNKLYDDDSVNFLKSFGIFGLTEIWSCDQFELRDVLNEYFCLFCPAKKDKKFGRPMGGVAVYLKNYLKTYVHQLVHDCNFGIFIQINKTVFGTDRDIILAFVYIPPYGSPFYKTEALSCIELLEHRFMSLPINLSEYYFILCGDFNVRTGERLNFIKVDMNIPEFQKYHDIFDMGEIPVRKSCDKTITQNGKDLLNFCKVYSVVIINGRCGNDLNGSFTYISAQGCSLIDYILCSPDLLPLVLDFNVEFRTESKDLPVCATLKKHHERESNTTQNNDEGQSRIRFDFSGANREIFRQSLKNLFNDEQKLLIFSKIEDSTESTDVIAQMFVSCLCEASVQYNVKTKRKSNQPWFDQQCASLKSDKYRLLRKFRVSYLEEDRDAYLRAKNRFKQTCAEKKSEYQAMKLDDLISSANDQKSFWSKQ